LIALGLGADYGMVGCAAYDEDQSSTGCQSNRGSHCLNPWCWVDMTLCPLNKDLCKASGSVEGTDSSPYCRTRPRDRSNLEVNFSLYYSYETCNSVNVYDMSRLFEPISGKSLKTAVDAWGPWLVLRKDYNGHEKFGGPLWDFFTSSLDTIEPAPLVNIVPGWATSESRQKFSSSYTACVHDVAVGNRDICVADLWVTPERNQLANFLPTVKSDNFHLVVPRKIEEITFYHRISRPFMPFSRAAWFGIAGFLFVIAGVFWIEKRCEDGSCCRSVSTWQFSDFVEFQFNTWRDFLQGETNHDTEKSLLRKFTVLGFLFFTLVTLASYTASLASMLVLANQPVGAVNNIHEATIQKVPVCLPEVLQPSFRRLYPQTVFVAGSYMEYLPRMLHAGKCGAMVVSNNVLDQLYAGRIQEDDCAAVASGSLTEEEGRCQTDFTGRPRNDCELMQVGDMLWSIPVAFPVSPRLIHTMSWAFMYALSAGAMEQSLRVNADVFPVSLCKPVEARSVDDGLLLSDLLGTFFVSMVIIILGLLSFSLRLCWRGVPRPRVSVRNRVSLWSLPPVVEAPFEAPLGSPTLDTESDKPPNDHDIVSVDFSVDLPQTGSV